MTIGPQFGHNDHSADVRQSKLWLLTLLTLLDRTMKKLSFLLPGLCLLLSSVQSLNAAGTLEGQTVLAALSLNIVRFTNWPPETRAQMKNAINFCVAGDNGAQESFATIDNKAVGDKTLHVVNLSRLRNFEQCHVLYIDELKQNVLSQMLLETKKRPLLTIGEGHDFAAQGGMVGLGNIGGKIILQINLPVVRESNLSIDARLLKLAKIIAR